MAPTSFLIPLVVALAQTPTPQSISERQMESAKRMAEAANRQRTAAQMQTTPIAPDSFFAAGWSGPSMVPAPVADCPTMSEAEAEPLIRAASAHNGLNPALIKAVIRQESGFKPCVVSDKGAVGLMQIMPATAGTLGAKDPFDPAQNVDAGALYLKQMLTRFNGDVRLALAAYNAGPERVDGPKPSVPDIAETRDYVASIMAALHGEPAGLAAQSPQNEIRKDQ
jgi:soluble lytic murein transglycosylase-like protein